ncbi:hypothetical protein DAPPUDRAFT_238048 [Daphnia pulex]|uniref:Uncharacterized protein n=1 Tax=Daphnia pulex TaxID=6669 RepID=E9G533_DAPPU|nr:hypothetical protein DAPPUDRAFT_238048 [Daphnia pulex]|eukprot:EFX85450.1 hypothetical protein DAPPUDRAFT_238048 [Daphnia pulex]
MTNIWLSDSSRPRPWMLSAVTRLVEIFLNVHGQVNKLPLMHHVAKLKCAENRKSGMDSWLD